jgi:F0F1-type ATP synthase membrane subunit b/b'
MNDVQTQWERRIAHLEQQLCEATATAEGYRLALAEAEQKIAEAERQAGKPVPQDESQSVKSGEAKGRAKSK